jgi:hypothetical protein
MSDLGLKKVEEAHCHDCKMIASSPKEEATANGFSHVKVFDSRRRVVVRGDDKNQQEKAAAGGLEDDGGYYWLCPGCFHHMRETLLVVGSSDLSDNFLTDVDKT